MRWVKNAGVIEGGKQYLCQSMEQVKLNNQVIDI
jgi:hypothetical protein